MKILSKKDLKTFIKFLDYLNEGILVIDEKERIVYLNKYGKEILNLERPEGKHFSEVIENNYLYSIIAHKYEEDRQEEIIIDDRKFLVKIYHIDGKKFIHFTDITPFEIYKQAKKDFVSNVSHELKTPLAVLKGVLETLESEEMDDNKRKFLKMALKRINQMDSLVNDLLIIARLEAQEYKVIKTEINLKKLVNQIFEDLNYIAKEKNIKLINSIPSDLKIKGDEKKICILLKNLIENGVKYNKENGLVDVKGYIKEKYFVIEVIDTGIGIPAKSLPLIFERFYRVDKSRSRSVGGTGLGLSIVKHITEAHNGKIEVESEVNKGTKFRIYLPME
ncbi:MAG: PAS domain-containing sensor histidine kinase [Persephonella sp.]|nr:MAG: PAS domain-containing sensor histidine kinase [Persephonella sp.]